MIIESIKLKNFQSYYGDENSISFSKGLNVITGSIASGKSKLFDAFYWTLNDKIFVTGKDWVRTKDLKVSFVNDKAKYETNAPDDLVETSVEIVVRKKIAAFRNKEIDYLIRRELFITRKSLADPFLSNTWVITPSKLSIEYINPENHNTEIAHGLEAENIIEDLFPAKISPYIWFQGEALDKLIDFDNKGTISRAIDYISYVPLYKIMKNIMFAVNEKIDNRKGKELRKLTTDIKAYDILLKDINEQKAIIKNNTLFIEQKQGRLGEYTAEMEIVETQLTALSEFPALSEERSKLDYEIHNITSDIERLDIEERKKFSSLWMLNGCEHILSKAEDVLLGFEDYRQSLIDKEYKLPDDVPGDVYINKMLKNEKCLICERPAEKGSEAYTNIEAKLNRKTKPEYLNKENEKLHIEVISYKSRLWGLTRNLSSVSSQIIIHKKEISDAIDKREILKEKLAKVNNDIDALYTKRGIDVSDGAKSHRTKNSEYKTLNEVIRNLARKIEGAKASIADSMLTIKKKEEELNKIKRTHDDVNVIEEEMVKYTSYLNEFISVIEKREYEKLINLIESEANMYFLDITSVNNTIDGNIKIDRETYRVINVDDEGRELENFNTGHYTLMKMCIINAIISLTNDFKEESYPFITDAPTSNLDDKATFAYLKSISETYEQSIVITKDISSEEIKTVKALDYVNTLIQLKIENNNGSDIMDRKEAFTKITNLKN